MKAIAILQLVRLHNIVFFLFAWCAAVACVLRFDLFRHPFIDWFLTEYLIVGVAIGFIMAGAYAINDYYDLPTDTVNKGKKIILGAKLKKRTGILTHWICSFIGCFVLSAWAYFSDSVTWEVIPIAVIMVIMLVWYSTYLKSIPFFGNFFIAAAIGLSFLLPAFTLPDYLSNEKVDTLRIILQFLAMFAFGSNLLREWAKDVYDVKGDKIAGRKTLPIIFKWKQNKLYGITLNTIYIFSLFGYVVYLYNFNTLKSFIFLFFLSIVPLIYINFLIFKSSKPDDFKIIVFLYKAIMLTGILGVLWMEFQ